MAHNLKKLLDRLIPGKPMPDLPDPSPASAMPDLSADPVDPDHHRAFQESAAPFVGSAPVEPAPPPAPKAWENFICLNFDTEPVFEVLNPAAAYRDGDARLQEWTALDYETALARDTSPLPMTADREGYYGPDHFSYWASGLLDARYLIATAKAYGVNPATYLDIGCATGRVLRHMAYELPGIKAIGCDLNRHHVEWCNRFLPSNCQAFHSHSIPSLPIADNAVDVVSAYSVFTHIEAMETAWLMEINRILRPGGIAWITVHTDETLVDMTPDWPLWDPVMSHPEASEKLDNDRQFAGDRLVLRWQADRSYSSNVFYKQAYLQKTWSRFFNIVETKRRFPTYQDVLILQKPL